MSRLRQTNHQAYLVGGAVRDLLLGGRPKDFDVATSATPEEVNALFRNSRIIGRRFRIVHVRFGREIIEVTTFRGHHDSDDGTTSQTAQRSDKGLLLRDNVFGTLEEDAIRRDLTVNALYYDSGSFEVFDHAGGMEDLEDEQIRVIGDAAQRYREDPVRMLRTLRFAAKLNFGIARTSAEPIPELAHLLEEVPSARLFDEFGKLFLAGNAQTTLELMQSNQVFEHLFPDSARLAEQDPFYARLLDDAMFNTDERIRQGKPVTPAFILAAILWPAVCERRAQLESQGEAAVPAMHGAGQEVVAKACQRVAIPKRFSMPMREIWEMQSRLTRTQGKRVIELMGKRRFRAAYDFLLLREQAGEDCNGLGKIWTDLQIEHGPIEVTEVSSDDDHRPKRRRRGGRRRQAPTP